MCAKPDTTGLLADIAYAIFQVEAEAKVGRERCCLYRRADSGYWITSELDLASPFFLTRYVEIRAGADWRVESLDVRLSGSVQRDASHRAEGRTWQATIQTDEATVERVVPFGQGLSWNSTRCGSTHSPSTASSSGRGNRARWT
jgi:hypothetical protein